MQDEGGGLWRFVLSLVAAAILLVLLVVIVSRPVREKWQDSATGRAPIVATVVAVNFTLPPLPPLEVTTYYLVGSEAEAESVRAKADEDAMLRRAAGQPSGGRVVALVVDSPDAEVVYRAELTSMAQRSLQAGYGVRYDVVDLRGH